MSTKKINKEQIVSVKVYNEKLYKGYVFEPEKIYKIPFTNIVWQHTYPHWTNNKSMHSTYSGDELKDFIVRNDQLIRKPYIRITFSSGWRDDVVKYFNTIESANEWIERNLSGIKFVEVND